MASLTENTQRVVKGLEDAYDAVISKGGVCARKAEYLATNIKAIPGVDVRGTTATAADVRKGKIFFNKNGQETEGALAEEPFIGKYTPKKDAMNWFSTGTYEGVGVGIDGVNISDASHLLEGDALVTKDMEGNITSTILEGTMPNNKGKDVTITNRSGENSFKVDSTMCIDANTKLNYADGFGNATSDDVKAGVTFTSDNGIKITGTSEGGGDTVAGYFTTSMSGTHINLPFEPKYIMVNSAMGSTLAGSDVCVVNGDYYKGYQISSTTMTNKSSATDKSARFTIDTTGFTFKATATAYAGKTAYFVASKNVAEDKGA